MTIHFNQTLKEIYLKDIENLLKQSNTPPIYLKQLLKQNHLKIIVEEDNSLPLEFLEFSIRTYNCLRRVGITTLKQLYQLSDKKYHTIPYLSVKCIKEIKNKLTYLDDRYAYLKEEPCIVEYYNHDRKYVLDYLYSETYQTAKIIFEDLFDDHQANLLKESYFSSELTTYLLLMKGYYYKKDVYDNIKDLIHELENNSLKKELEDIKRIYDERNLKKCDYIHEMIQETDKNIINDFIHENKIQSLNKELENNELTGKVFYDLLDDIYNHGYIYEEYKDVDAFSLEKDLIYYMKNYLSGLLDNHLYDLVLKLLENIYTHVLCISLKDIQQIDNILKEWYCLWDRLLEECKDQNIIDKMKSFVVDQLYFVGTKQDEYNLRLFFQYFTDEETTRQKQKLVKHRLDSYRIKEDEDLEVSLWLNIAKKLLIDVEEHYEDFEDI